MEEKRCKECEDVKLVSNFYFNRLAKDGRSNTCSECAANLKKIKYRSLQGKAREILKEQKKRSKKKGLPIPSYTIEELWRWLLQHNYKAMWQKWKDSNYKRALSPSINRLESDIGYSFDNIELITWEEHDEKRELAIKDGKIVRYYGEIHKYSKEGKYIDTYPTMKEASRITGVSHGNISNVCSDRRKTAGGYIWEKTKEHKAKINLFTKKRTNENG